MTLNRLVGKTVLFRWKNGKISKGKVVYYGCTTITILWQWSQVVADYKIVFEQTRLHIEALVHPYNFSQHGEFDFSQCFLENRT